MGDPMSRGSVSPAYYKTMSSSSLIRFFAEQSAGWHNCHRMLKLTWPQSAAWRIRCHHLDQRARAGKMLAVASRLCGLHAQVMSSAELTVWVRVEHLDR
jgi:hypothetical protein